MNRLPLRAQVAIVAFALLALVMSAILWQTLQAYRRGASELIEQSELSKLDILGVFARDVLLTREFAPLQPHLEALVSSPDVTNAMLVDEEGLIVASSVRSQVGTSAVGSALGPAWKTREVGLQGQPSGELAVEFSTTRREALDRSVREQAIVAGLAGVLLCAATSILAAHLVSRRLARVVRAAREVQEGNLSARVDDQGGDEIGELGRAFDEMVERLAVTQAELQEQQSHLEDLVEARTGELRSLQATLLAQERLSALGELTATVSHELRNPLGTIGASLHVLRKQLEELPEGAARSLSRADRNISRCVRIIDDLKDYSSPQPLRPRRFDLDGLVTMLVEDTEWGEAARFEVNLEAGANPCADRELVGKAIRHLLRNATQASLEGAESGGVVRVATALDDGCALVTISDDGCGIREEDMPRIFDPLFSTRAFGTGLGLPLSRQILDCHDGTLSIQSASGQGTTVTVRLPVAGPPDVLA